MAIRGRAGPFQGVVLSLTDSDPERNRVAPQEVASAPAPATLFYVVTGGTGHDAGAKGHGTIALAEQGQTFRMTFNL